MLNVALSMAMDLNFDIPWEKFEGEDEENWGREPEQREEEAEAERLLMGGM